jgi:predicted Na+-dependent transporter
MQKLPGKDLALIVVTLGLLFVITAALAWGSKSSSSSFADVFKKNLRRTLLAVLANFVVYPALVFLSLKALNLNAQITAGFALLFVVVGAPFVTIMSKAAKRMTRSTSGTWRPGDHRRAGLARR